MANRRLEPLSQIPPGLAGVIHDGPPVKPRDAATVLLVRGTEPWEVLMLRRTLAAQAVQFPELAKLAHEEGWLRGVRAVSMLLQQFAERGQIKIDDPAVAADLFLSLVLGTSDKLHGIVTRPKLQELRRQAAVKLFLNGVKPR